MLGSHSVWSIVCICWFESNKGCFLLPRVGCTE
nr:MAG TPA: hypothetical protein [Caudoviricetes sp.]